MRFTLAQLVTRTTAAALGLAALVVPFPATSTSGVVAAVSTPSFRERRCGGARHCQVCRARRCAHRLPGGRDTNPGTLALPLRTIGRALTVAPAWRTIAVRGGVYRERLSVSRPVVLQSYPGEAVWLDGSSPVSGWIADGTAWRKEGWTTRFDHSPTYTKGAPDSTMPGWQFVDPVRYPMAAHPDQLFIDGVAQRQVKSKTLVVQGTFFLDERTSQLYVGTRPVGRTVEVSTLPKALSIRAAGTVVRGIGVRRYAPSVWHMGAVTMEARGPASRTSSSRTCPRPA